jgi:hypothetical protein
MIRVAIAVFCLTCTFVFAAPSPVPKPLRAQVERLTALLKDSHATGYPEATMFQTIKLRADRELVLVIFTIEGFGGGNNHTQYLAAFDIDRGEKSTPYYTLIDVMPIAGKGWRGVVTLNARVAQAAKGSDLTIDIDALEVAGEDAPNFPSKKIVINAFLKDGRLGEKAKRP